MSFTSQPGTYGARQPGAMIRLVNSITARLIRRSGKLGSVDALVLTTIGRKSGEERSTPLNYVPGPDGSWLIVASANGAAADPAWFLNLSAAPHSARIELAGRSSPVHAEQLAGEERAEAWRTVTAANSRFAGYEGKTDRVIPVIRLTERSA